MFKILYYIFGALIAAIAILVIISSFPVTGNVKIFIVQSGSMEPDIKTGSIVLIRPAESYKIGDVITFGKTTNGKVPTTHRIVEIRLQSGVPMYTTKGDANNAPDINEVPHKDVVGRVLFDVPYLGFALAAAKKPIGFLVLIVIPALIIIFDEAKKIWQEFKKRKNREAHETT